MPHIFFIKCCFIKKQASCYKREEETNKDILYNKGRELGKNRLDVGNYPW